MTTFFYLSTLRSFVLCGLVIFLCLPAVLAQDQKGPIIVGDEYQVDVNPGKSYGRNTSPGFVFEYDFEKTKSSYVRLHFKDFNLASGDYVEVSNTETGQSFVYAGKGKIISTRGAMISDFWSTTILGDHAKVRLWSTGGSNQTGFTIDKVAYGYTKEKMDQILNVNNGFTCGFDDREQTVCFDGTEIYDRSRAVCGTLISGVGLCTGWLLGSEGHVVTAAHCISSQGAANNTDFIFDFEKLNCDGSGGNSQSNVVASFATLIKDGGGGSIFSITPGSNGLDYSLLRLPVNPTNIYGFLQVSGAGPEIGDRVYTSGHPGQRPKQTTVTSNTSPSGFSEIATVSGNTLASAYVDPEGGASGSPIIDYNNHTVLSILSGGGTQNCNPGGVTGQAIMYDLEENGLLPANAVGGAVDASWDFETIIRLTGWTQSTSDTHDWDREPLDTPSSGTGPTGAAQGSFFSYLETSNSGANSPGEDAILTSPVAPNATTMSFYYHMFGADIGTLFLEVLHNGTWVNAWSRSGNQGDAWFNQTVNLSAYSSPTLQVRFRGVAAGGFRGDIAIDDITLVGNLPIVPAVSGSPIPGDVVLDFDNGFFAGWSQAHDHNWLRHIGGTPTSSTGPSSAAQGNFYGYLETSPGFANNSGDIAILESPLLPAGAQSFSFSYHMFGDNIGSLSVIALANNRWRVLFFKATNQGNRWFNRTINLDPATTRIRIIGAARGGSRGDMAIDDVSVSFGSQLLREGDQTAFVKSFSDDQLPLLYETILNGKVSKLAHEKEEEQVVSSSLLTSLHVYPNPSNGLVTFEIPEEFNDSKEVRFFDVRGRQVAARSLKGSTNLFSTELNELSNGIYIIQLNSKGKRARGRVVITNR